MGRRGAPQCSIPVGPMGKLGGCPALHAKCTGSVRRCRQWLARRQNGGEIQIFPRATEGAPRPSWARVNRAHEVQLGRSALAALCLLLSALCWPTRTLPIIQIDSWPGRVAPWQGSCWLAGWRADAAAGDSERDWPVRPGASGASGRGELNSAQDGRALSGVWELSPRLDIDFLSHTRHEEAKGAAQISAATLSGRPFRSGSRLFRFIESGHFWARPCGLLQNEH